MKKEITAKLKFLRMSPRKVRLVLDLIRGLGVNEALVQLQMLYKQAAKPVLKLLKSAMANAKNNFAIEEESLKIKTVFVDSGPTLKRWTPRAMGRATPIRKRTSHITIILEGETKEKSAKKKEKIKEKKIEKVKVEKLKN